MVVHNYSMDMVVNMNIYDLRSYIPCRLFAHFFLTTNPTSSTEDRITATTKATKLLISIVDVLDRL